MYEDLQAVNVIARSTEFHKPFDVRLVSESGQVFSSLSGVRLVPDGQFSNQVTFDTVLMPVLYDDGCLSDAAYGPILTSAERDWLLAQHAGGARFSMMCSSALALADTGLLDGHATSMIAMYLDAFRERFPNIDVRTGQTLVVSGERGEFVSGGDSVYSADVSLYTIRQHLGPEIALRFARLYCKAYDEVLYDLADPPKLAPVIEDRSIAFAKHFILGHLEAPALVAATARMLNISERSFTRRFKRITGEAPSTFIRDRRIDRARSLLSESRLPIEEIAARVGYADRAAFAKGFRQKVGSNPAEYRAQFQAPARMR